MLSHCRWLLAASLAPLLLTGCFAPSDPDPVPVGLRLDGEVLTAYVPLCPGERLTEAHIDEPVGDGRELWRGQEPHQPENKVVQLSGQSWAKQTGSYRLTGQEFTVDVSTTGMTYSGGARSGQKLDGLPAGRLDLDGKQVTPQDLDARARCEKSG